jgi:sugar O-acyltransferase (sialic acid O-acetyltransferase NeuD family)
MRDLVIVGAGGFAREVAFLVADINRVRPEWNLLGYIDRDADTVGTQLGPYAIIGTDDYFSKSEREIHAVIGIGEPRIIAQVADRLRQFPQVQFPSLIHPSVISDIERVKFGDGNIVCAGNIFTTDISVGSYNILNLSCTFGHDAVIGNCNVVNPGVNVSGGVIIEDRCLLGTGATILQNRKISTGAVVGAGALVAKDVDGGVTVVGVPAKPVAK